MKTDQNNNMQGTLTKRRNMKKRKNAKRVLLALNLVAVIFTTTVFSNPVSVLSEEVSTDTVQSIENSPGTDAQIAEQADVQQNTAEAAQAVEAPAAEAPAAENSAEAAKAEEPSGVNAPAENAMSAEMNAAEDGVVSTDDGASSASAVQSADTSSASNGSFEDAGAGNTDGTKDGIIENDAEGLNEAEGTAANEESEDAASQEQLTYEDEHVKISVSYTDGRAFTADSILTRTYLDSDEKNAVLSAVNAQISKGNSADTVSDTAENTESSGSAPVASTTATTVEYSVAGFHALMLSAKNQDGSDTTTEGDVTFSAEFKKGLNDAGYASREETTENNEAGGDGSLTTTTTRCETSWKIYTVTEKNLTDITDITDAHNTHYEMDENGTLKSASFRGALPQTVAFVQIVKKTVTETTTQKETEKATEKETQKVTEKYTEKITGKAAEKTTETETEKEDVKAEVPASAAMPAVAFDQKVTTENGTVMVHIDAEEGAFEEGTSMTVTPVTRHDILDKAIDAAGGKGAAAAMDITFTKADGTKTEPLKPIHVKMISPVLNHAEEAHVVHVADSGTIDVVARKSDGKTIESTSSEAASSDAKNAVSFESDSFSVYAIVYTVDFEYTDPSTGETYYYSIKGEGSINLTDLLIVLGIKSEDEAAKFVAEEVTNVEFSNPELVKVTHKGKALGLFGKADWELKSLKPFDTEETLTISLKDGGEISVIVRDAQYTSDLNTLLTGVTVKLNGQKINAGDEVTVDKGDKFELHLDLEENDFYQFMDDSTPMTYQLPDGINLGEAFTTYIVVNMGIDGKVYRNPLTYDPTTNTVTLTWNTKDPNFKKLTSTDNTKVTIDLSGYFNEDASHVDFGLGLEVDVKHEEHHDANVEKNGQIYMPGEQGNPYGNNPAIKYTVKVTSDGTTTVNVNDTVEGSAVSLDTTNWSAESNKGTTITPVFNKKGFSLNGQSLQDGEEVTIEYWGIVDTSKVANLRNVTYSETGNKVTLTGENIPEKEVTHYEHEVSANKTHKTSTSVGPIVEDESGKKTQVVEWKIVVNDNPIDAIGGSTINDSISESSRDIMSYDTSTAPHMTVYDANGNVVRNSPITWQELGITDPATQKSWTYNIPGSDGAYKYEITYSTIVDVTNMTAPSSVTNNVETKVGDTTGTGNVGPKPEDQKYTVSKTRVDVKGDEVTWSITVTLDPDNYSSFDIEDIFPTMTTAEFGATDTLKPGSIEITGLEGTEWYKLEEKYEHTTDAYKKYGDDKNPSSIIFHIYKDGKNPDGSINENPIHPGIDTTSGQRTITIQLTTINNTRWLEFAVQPGVQESFLQHTNTAKVGNVRDTATATPMESTVYKYRGDSNISRVPQVNEGYTDADRSGGISYPMWTFRVVAGGVREDTVQITDYFDTDLFKIYMPDPVDINKMPRFWGGNKDKKYAAQEQLANEYLSYVEGDGKVTFTATNIPKDDKAYYDFYMVEYNLIPKNEEAWTSIKRLAMENGGEYLFNNTAQYGDSTDELKFKYEYDIIDKSSVSVPDADTGITLEKYTIKINPDKLKILPEDSDEQYMTMTDTYSKNLSVDFSSIHVTAVDKDGNDRTSEVTWDYRGHTGTFTIPDETYVVITYSARVVGEPGSVQAISNTAYMEGHSDTVSGERVVDMSGSSTAERVRVRLFKFAADHMEGGLDGAKFRLLDQDKNPVKDLHGNDIVYTTGLGYMNKYGVVNAEGDFLDYTMTADHRYDTGVSRGDLNDSGKSRWDAVEIENPTVDPEKLVTYKDLSPAGRAKLGITVYHGFAEITLDQKELGIALKKERAYYLEEIETPVDDEGNHYEKDFIKYSFLITDQSDYSAPAGVYVYHNNDILTVRNWPSEETTLKIAKTFTGNAELTEEQKNQVTFKIQKQNSEQVWEDYTVTVWDDEADAPKESATFTYGDYGVKTTGEGEEAVSSKGDPLFQDGIFTLHNIEAGTYRVIESNTAMYDTDGKEYSHTAEYLVDGDKQTLVDEDEGVSVTVTEEDIENKASHDVSITNTYFTNKYLINKVSSDTAQALANAKFKVVKVDNAGVETDVVNNLTSDENGKLSIQYNNNTWSSSFTFDRDTLYYVVETEAPRGFVLPEDPEKHYFYFSSDPAEGEERWAPSMKTDDNPDGILPEGESATDLSVGFGSATIPNKPDTTKTYVKIDKKWVNTQGKDVTNTMTDEEAVNVTLYRTTDKLTSGNIIDGGDEEHPKSASDTKTLTLKWGNNQEMKLSFVPGDRIQVTMKAAEGQTIKPSASGSDVQYQKKDLIGGGDWQAAATKSWLLTTTSAGNNPVITFTDENAFGLSASNIEVENRVYRLTQAEAQGIAHSETVEQDIKLWTKNNWTQIINNLNITDANGSPYFYYVVESGDFAQSTTSYDIGTKTITVTNTAPDQLEVNKKWEDSAGETVTNEKTDGSITYELYQVENEIERRPDYSGEGTINVKYDNLRYGAYGSIDGQPTFSSESDSHLDHIKEGSNIQIIITTNNTWYDLSTALTGMKINGAEISGSCERIADGIRRIIEVDDVSKIELSGIIEIPKDYTCEIAVKVLAEPHTVEKSFDELTKRKMGEVTVTYSGATLTKEPAFERLNFRAAPGTKHWSSLIYNLPSVGIVNGEKINYAYYVVEKDAPVGSDYEAPTYQVNGENVEHAVANLGETAVIINKEKEVPKGSVKVTKVFDGISNDEYPQNFVITASWTIDSTEEISLTTTGDLPENVSRTGSGTTAAPYEWTISNLPIGTEVTFTETGYDVSGYNVTVTGSATADDKTTATAVVAETTNSASFVNTYTPNNLEVTKIWKDQEDHNIDWVKDITIFLHKKPKTGDEVSYKYTVKEITGEGGAKTYSAVPEATEAPTATVSGDKDNGYTIKWEKLETGFEYSVTEETVTDYNDPIYAIKVGNQYVGTDRETGDKYTSASNEGYIINKPLDAVTLPETGGPGTKLFYGLGISFVGFAGLLLFIKRRELRDLSKRRW